MSLHPCIGIIKEWDIVGARQLGRNIAKDMGFGTVDQARIATAISELARNIYLYASKGKICLEVINTIDKKGICLVAIDDGPGKIGRASCRERVWIAVVAGRGRRRNGGGGGRRTIGTDEKGLSA